ncbi:MULTISPECIES: ABC transporter ATP-binding protein [Oceanobacillus]|uniref:ABC transporter ATP-binding protein YwjA n=1 Tax=Oceanobacillus kimchii TaxID=746691 RepID=A0ABQ5TR33_9BACI|nr:MULTISPECIES: ABC transporter ATP-binding protein [Oceanobacillus]MBT2599949.1 ABC transporter ATP-binding protein [Oceanobacillus sp. ISL-74]MBT2652601.1 ABC transporter ATP-binding protein [Oceanobacillus sp. ISL-73]MCT1577140.1 ABC transporter ATP-binding protein/permease [Oceanobacillus kimchii]MCT2135210.1 ABC transporter ATP-binding protein/permease [Oceanobacillus kimchii]OEH56481.1 multidrug ABC transporter ATP-binding protein [Oceanobacillus sp. E9]
MLKWFFSYYKPHKRLFIIDFSAAVFVALLELAFPVAVQWFIDRLLPGEDWNAVVTVAILLLLVYIISTYLQYVVAYLGHKLGINIETDMRRDLFYQVQRQSFRFFDNTKTGHIMSRITNDLFDLGELAHHGPEDFFISIMTFIGAFIIMFTINPLLAMIILILVPILIFLITYGNIRMNKAWKKMYGNIADVNARVEDAVSGVRVVQSFTNETFEKERFQKDNEKFRLAKVGAYKVMGIVHSNIYLLMRLMTLTVLVIGAWLTYQGQLTAGELVSFILFVNVLTTPINKITALLELYPKGMAGFKRFTDLMKVNPDVQDKEDAVEVDELKGNIQFQDVTFGYEESHRAVLNNMNFTVKPGETVAFVGPSGAGKTTISALIPRFYDVTEGSITIDGIDIRDMTKESLRRQIGVVQQDVFLFTGTLRENIAYGKLDATNEEIELAAKRAHMEDFINELPNGYETQVGERGLKLSGGQKQRIAIARMFLKNPPILILDEATSALDTETEMIIQTALNELAESRTTIVIAHRLATIKEADRIMVVTKKGIEEEGSHEDLLQKRGLFAHLHDVQMKK